MHLVLHGIKEPLCLKWFQDIQIYSELLKKYLVKNCRTFKTLDLPTRKILMKALMNNSPHMDGIWVSIYSNGKPSTLTGLDFYKLKFRVERHSLPLLTKSHQGWVICEWISTDLFGHKKGYWCHICKCNLLVNNDEELQKLVKDSFLFSCWKKYKCKGLFISHF